MFSFGPGCRDSRTFAKRPFPGTGFPKDFNTVAPTVLLPGDPAQAIYVSAGSVGRVQLIPLSTANFIGTAPWAAPDLDAIADGSLHRPCLDGHVGSTPNRGYRLMNGNIPAPFGGI